MCPSSSATPRTRRRSDGSCITSHPGAGASEPDPLLILGEKGTGKDLVARYLHAYSSRHDRPFVAINCAEIRDELAAAQFFGHRRGSFTGAVGDAPGFFRAAQGGVLFLDEIAELSLKAQGTLLRVLENRTIVPVGDTRELRVDVQVLLATNRDPERLVAEGALKPDLYDRFRTQALRLQPLRERPWDVPARSSNTSFPTTSAVRGRRPWGSPPTPCAPSSHTPGRGT